MSDAQPDLSYRDGDRLYRCTVGHCNAGRWVRRYGLGFECVSARCTARVRLVQSKAALAAFKLGGPAAAAKLLGQVVGP